MNPQEFGWYIKALREEKSMTVTELAKAAGISHPYLSQIENGRKGVPSIKVLKKLSEPLSTPLLELQYKAGYVDYLPPAVDFLGADLEEINTSFSELKRNYGLIRDLEEKYAEVLNHDKISPDKLKNLIYDDSIKNGVANLFQDLKSEIRKLQDKKLASGADLKKLLEGSGKVRFNGHTLSDQDQQRILVMLETMFPDYA